MKTLINTLAMMSLVATSGTSYAEDVTSAGKAVSLCRVEAMTRNTDFVRSKATRIKETRSGYNITLKVYLADSSVNSNCEITREGQISYQED